MINSTIWLFTKFSFLKMEFKRGGFEPTNRTFEDADLVVDVGLPLEGLDEEAEVDDEEAEDDADHHPAVQLLKVRKSLTIFLMPCHFTN